MTAVTCPTCSERGKVPPGSLGARIKCKKCVTSFTVAHPTARPSGAAAPAGTTDTHEPRPGSERGALTPAGLVSLVAGLGATIVGAAAVVVCFTAFSGWSIPLAMVALVVGSLGLLLDWFRDTTRFTTSAPGVAVATVAISIAFVQQGGLDFRRYKPIVMTKVVTEEVTREAAEGERVTLAAALQRLSSKVETRRGQWILLTTKYKPTADRQLVLVTFCKGDWKHHMTNMFNTSIHWEAHADGIGYIHKWNGKPAAVVVGSPSHIEDILSRLQKNSSRQLDVLRQKWNLGEIDEIAFEQQCLALQMDAQSRFLELANKESL
jgi:hypothetical protein